MSKSFVALFAILLFISSFSIACAGDIDNDKSSPILADQNSNSKILLIGVDGATWSIMHPMMLQGRLQNIAKLVENGSHGNLLSLAEYKSPALWNTLVTGFAPEDHGITHFVLPDPQSGELVPINSTMRTTKAIWNVLSEYDRSVGVVGFWATWPAEPVNGVMISDRAAFTRFRASSEFRVGGKLVPFNYTGDRFLTYPEDFLDEIRPILRDPSELTLEEAQQIYPENRKLANEMVRTRWTGNFNTEAEAAAQIKFQYVTDKSYGQICEKLLLEERPDFAAVYFDGTDVICHMYGRHLVQLNASPELNDPLLEAILNYYDFVDRLVGDLLKAMGGEYTVVLVSDHGFGARLEIQEPRASRRVWTKEGTVAKRVVVSSGHHVDGVILLSGPGIKKGHILQGATLVDIVPTLAVLSGVPISLQLPGRPLLDAITPEYLASFTSNEIETYGDRSISPVGIQSPEDRELIERLRSLGYIE